MRVALITGASSGIGYATALAFAREGTHVAVTARNAERLSGLQQAANGLSGEILAISADVRDAEAMQNAVAQTLERFGRLDVLVANAGIGQRGALADESWEHLETVLRTNIDGVLHSVRAAVPAMRQSGGGHIIMVSSVMANMPSPYAATYSASKAFVSNLAASLRLELERDNIWVTDVLVGQTHTEFAERRLGQSGRVASFLPTMTPEYVANRIVRASHQRKKQVVLRLLDRLIILGNTITPGIMGMIARRIYGKKS